MPAQVLPTVETFEEFCDALMKLGFVDIDSAVAGKHNFKPPVRRRGREAGFIFTTNGLSVVVWTTFLREEGCSRKIDAGWVLICKGNAVLCSSHPLNKTKNFLSWLLAYASIARQRLLVRPRCPTCQSLMEIARNEGALKARYWLCHRGHSPGYRSWDHGLSTPHKEFLQKERKRHKSYRARLQEKREELDAHRHWMVVHYER